MKCKNCGAPTVHRRLLCDDCAYPTPTTRRCPLCLEELDLSAFSSASRTYCRACDSGWRRTQRQGRHSLEGHEVRLIALAILNQVKTDLRWKGKRYKKNRESALRFLDDAEMVRIVCSLAEVGSRRYLDAVQPWR